MLYQIGDFANMAQISRKQLKYYEQCGLIVPARIDADSGYRYYEAEQLRLVAHVRAFMSMGFTTSEIKELLGAKDYSCAFDRKQSELEAAIDEYRRKLSLLAFYRDAIRDHDFNQPYRTVIKTTMSGLMATERLTLPNVPALVDEWQALYNAACDAGALVSPSIAGLTRFHDKEFELENFDAELLLLLEKRGGESPRFSYTMVEPIMAASVIHRGAYSFLHEAYAFTYMWIDRNGYRACGLPMESYLCGPSSKKPESEYITELYIPIEKLN